MTQDLDPVNWEDIPHYVDDDGFLYVDDVRLLWFGPDQVYMNQKGFNVLFDRFGFATLTDIIIAARDLAPDFEGVTIQ